MLKPLTIKGVVPSGRVVETTTTAPSVQAAKAQAQDAGLRFVIVAEEGEPPAAPETQASAR